MINKRLINTGVAAAAAFDPLQNFEVVTYTGNGGTQKITGYIRKGAAFNGSSSKIDLPLTTLGDSSFTISLWVNFNSVGSGSTEQYIFTKYDNAPSGQYGMLCQKAANADTISFIAYNTSNGTYGSVTTTTAMTAGTWYNYILVFGVGSSITAYLNGSQEATTTTSGTFGQNDDVLRIGAYWAGSSYLNGKIDQVRIFNKALSSSEVTTLYGETYASSTKSTTDIFGDGSGVALYQLDENANDTGINSGTIDSGQSIQGFSASNYAVFAPTGNFASNSTDGDGSISLWYNLNSIPSNGSYYTLIGKGNPTTGSTYQSLELNLFGTPNSNEIEFRFRRGFSGTNYDPTSYTSARVGALAGVWYNLVLTYASSTKTITFYVNNNLVGSYSLTSSVGGRTIDSGFNIGIYRTDIAQAFNGKLDEFRLYSDIVTSTEIGYLSSNDTGNIPTGNLEAYYKFDGNITDSSGNGNNGTLTGTLTYTDPAEIETSFSGTPTNVNFLGMAFTPDLVLSKARSFSEKWNIFDVNRGATQRMYLNGTHADATQTNSLTSFDSNGYSIGAWTDINTSSATYVSYSFKGGGNAVNNTDGVTARDYTAVTNCTVSANQSAGFSICKFTTPSSGRPSFGHGLSSAPEFIIIKSLGIGNWDSHFPSFLGQSLTRLESIAEYTYAYTMIQSDSTKVNIGNNPNYNIAGNQEHIAYCFHSVDSYQKVGSYSGSNSNLQVTTGFQPRFVLLKNKDAAVPWLVFDNIRSGILDLSSNLESDTASNYISFNSTGFELVGGTGSYINIAGYTWIYLAIA